MKTTFFTRSLVAGLFLIGLFDAKPVAAQEQPECFLCSCSATLFAQGCSIKCCKPLVGNCTCGIWINTCECTTAIPTFPELFEQNIRDFAGYLRTNVFTSPAAASLVHDIPLYLEAYAAGSADTFFAIAERLEYNTSRLSTTEKQLANQWIAARGGNPNTIP